MHSIVIKKVKESYKTSTTKKENFRIDDIKRTPNKTLQQK